MKRIIAFLLALTLCCGLMAACAPAENTDGTTAGATIEDAAEYLVSCYRSDEGKKYSADYTLMGQLLVKGTKFEVTWTVDREDITFETVDGKCTVKLPSKNETEAEYTLTATIKDADGKTVSKTFKRILPVYDNTAIVSELTEGVAYKMYLVQATAGKTLYALGETQSDNKYIKTDIDPKKGLDFYCEKVGGGYKFYTTIDGVKNYVHAKCVTSEDGKVSKYLGYATESDCVYYFKSETKAWYVMIDNLEYVLGTYSDYTTMCISDSSYMTAESTGVSQFPVTFMVKEDAEKLAPTEGPADPTELSTIPQILEIAGALDDKAQTAEKYLVKGTITEIANETYGNLYIEDEAGNKLYVYGIYSKDGSTRFDAMDPQPKVGDTVTLMGVLSKYNDAPQMKNGWVQELVSAGGGETEEPVTPNEPVASTGEMVTAPEVGKAYKWGMVQENVGKTLYFAGSTANKDYYLSTTESYAEATSVYLEAASGGYYMYFNSNGAKKYIDIYYSDNGYINIRLIDAPSAVFTWDSTYHTLVTTVTTNDGAVGAYIGTYKEYTTLSASNAQYIGSSFPAHLYN